MIRSIILTVGLVLTLSLFVSSLGHKSYAIWNGPDNTTAGIVKELNDGAGNSLSPHYNQTLKAAAYFNATFFNEEAKQEVQTQLQQAKLEQQAQQQHDQLVQQVLQEHPELAPDAPLDSSSDSDGGTHMIPGSDFHY